MCNLHRCQFNVMTSGTLQDLMQKLFGGARLRRRSMSLPRSGLASALTYSNKYQYQISKDKYQAISIVTQYQIATHYQGVTQ